MRAIFRDRPRATSWVGLALLSVISVTPAAPAFAADCASVVDNEELEDLEIGDIVYGDTLAKIIIRIRSIDIDLEEICDREECFDANELFSSDAIAACGTALGTGAIFLYGDEEGDDPEDPDGNGDN